MAYSNLNQRRIHIRRFRDSDAVALVRVHRGTIRGVNSKDYSKSQIRAWANRSTAKRFKDLVRKNTRFVAIHTVRIRGKLKEKVVGFADYYKNELEGMYIHKNHLGEGIGKRLLSHLEKDAYKNGIRTLRCTSTITAKAFYEKQGFKTIKKTTYTIGDQRLPVYRMMKRLRGQPKDFR